MLSIPSIWMIERREADVFHVVHTLFTGFCGMKLLHVFAIW